MLIIYAIWKQDQTWKLDWLNNGQTRQLPGKKAALSQITSPT